MGVKGQLVGEFELRSSADEFYHQCRHKPHYINTFSEHIQDCELHQGNFGEHGIIVNWSYTLPDGKVGKAKDRVELNEETKQISWTVLEGELMEDYKNLVVTLHPITRQGQDDLIKWTVDYEKLRDDVPHPFQLLGMLLNLSDHMEADHLKAAA